MGRVAAGKAEFPAVLARARRRLAHVGTAALLALSLGACGASDGAGGDGGDQRSGHSGSGGSGVSGTGGDANGGSGVVASGGSSGDPSGGRGGSAGSDVQSGGGAGLAARPGAAQPLGRTCRTQADCPTFAQCVANPPTGAGNCGLCAPTIHACTTDEACGAGQFCGAEPKDPCQCMGASTRCFPKCTSDSCLPSEVCGADGRCAPKSCQDGYACPTGTLCDATRPGDAHHCAPARCDFNEMSCGAEEVCDASVTAPASHCRAKRCGEGAACPKNHSCNPQGNCERLKCASDADCECGACISGTCQDHLYMCFTPPA